MVKIIQNILLILVFLTPLFGVVEGFGAIDFTVPFTLVFIKSLKLFIIFLVVFLTVCRLLFTDFFHLKSVLLLFLLFVFTLMVFLLSSNIYIALAGLSWSLPFFLIFLLVGAIDVNFLYKLTKVLVFVLISNTLLQLAQMFYMPAYRGFNFFGLSGRLAGFFSSASSAGILSSFVYFSIKYFSNFNLRWKNIFLAVSVLSVFLSMSSTGVGLLVIIIMYPFYLKSKNKIIGILFFVPLIFTAISYLDVLTGRDSGSSESSFTTRLSILFQQIENSEIISTNFGKATNMGVSIERNLNIYVDGVFITDMMYTSLLVNYGWLITFILLGLLLITLIHIKRLNSISLNLFIVMCLLGSSALIITEIFPINMLIAIYSAYYIFNVRNKYYQK